MNSKSEWNAVNDEVTADARRKLGDPPTAEEVLAYSRGELSPDEEERMRELLVCYPEIARVMFASEPDDDVQPGEPGYVSDAELGQRLAALQDRLHIPKAAPSPRAQHGRVLMWRYVPIAAVLALVSGLYIQTAREMHRLSQEMIAPRVGDDERVATSDAQRGGGAGMTLDPDASSYTVVVSTGSSTFSDYRLEILDYATQKPLWKSSLLHRTRDDNQTFSIFFGRGYLQPGEYQVFVYGVDNGRETHLDTISFALPRAAAR
ncbi:MAG TPA: hypothetical protein VE974_21455 [Thermoanaerobaculia bacterium]|nr:hypothetical protein [Thermoanaerobaculia bacterium]